MLSTVNNHILFPHQANWTNPPEWSRRWETEIADAVTGAESRAALRSHPLVSLAWTVTPWSLQEQAQLDDRIRAAKKSGKACAPFWGRASVLQTACNASTAVVQGTHWTWSSGNSIFFLDASNPANPIFRVRQITNVSGQTLTLDASVAHTFPAGSLVYPLLFGKFECEEISVETSRRSEARLKISEMISAASQGLGAASSGGIGVMKLGDTFEIS